jgi:nicotinamide-nucleotide amidase
MVAMTPESVLNEALADLFARRDGVELTILAAKGVIRLRLSGPDGSPEIQRRRDEIVRRIGSEIIVHEGPVPQTAAEAVVGLFAGRGWTIATAESCTGGGIAQAITEVSGSSAVLQAGWVTYSNASKSRELGVPEELIAQHGAVSREVALAMAERARLIAGTSHAVSVTGVAGPTGGTEEKPVGTVWMAVASETGSQAIRRQFRGKRDEVRQWSVNHGVEILRRHALGIDLNLYLGGPDPRYIAG